MDNTIRVFSGRTFNPEDIEIIRWARKTYPKLARNEFAGTVCELLGWTTPGGTVKRAQCMAFLEKLEEEGIIQLPPVDIAKQNKCRDGDKQDCERKGFYRMAWKLKKIFRDTKLSIVADGLYACGPIITMCRKFRELGIRGFINYLGLACKGSRLDKDRIKEARERKFMWKLELTA